MKNQIVISFLLIVSIAQLNGQIFSDSPKNIKGAIKKLDKNLSIETKNKMLEISSDSLLIWYKDSGTEFDVMDNWFYKWTRRSVTKEARLGKYYSKKGLSIPMI